MGSFGNSRGTAFLEKQAMARTGKPREQRRGRLLYKENRVLGGAAWKESPLDERESSGGRWFLIGWVVAFSYWPSFCKEEFFLPSAGAQYRLLPVGNSRDGKMRLFQVGLQLTTSARAWELPLLATKVKCLVHRFWLQTAFQRFLMLIITGSFCQK